MSLRGQMELVKFNTPKVTLLTKNDTKIRHKGNGHD